MAPDADAGKSVKRADPFAPLTSEQLAVGDGHDIYVESVGRAGGLPAVYLHGGPGSGCQPDHRRLFDSAANRAGAHPAPRTRQELPQHQGQEHQEPGVERPLRRCGRAGFPVARFVRGIEGVDFDRSHGRSRDRFQRLR